MATKGTDMLAREAAVKPGEASNRVPPATDEHRQKPAAVLPTPDEFYREFTKRKDIRAILKRLAS